MKKILLVEDSEQVRTKIKKAFEGTEYELVVAEDGIKGATMLEEKTFDLVLLDYHLPGMSGVDILRTLQSKGHQPKCPILMLTAESEERGSEIKDLNIMAWIIKPVDEKRLRALVPQIIRYYNKKE